METYGIEKLGIINTSAVYRNLALRKKEQRYYTNIKFKIFFKFFFGLRNIY